MTNKWLCQTQIRIPEFYSVTKLHKPTQDSRPITSGCDGLKEKPSSLVGKLLQSRAQQQKSCLKDTTDFINCIEKTKAPTAAILVSMDMMSQEGINSHSMQSIRNILHQ